ncbi:MAG: hypothetical protein A3B74_05240 [Candidatus Kerfeldbacteria bacterium RIFCSPHIGHO2_02_FULL_42_14]|uniref:DUF2207 domain-containing protein n=1 Tax=Candidatus Kerfeldbacteria bacterium RIFCSPHIGHO2_02_FULL_42_14 TaxID=1798540 RepID=A0A1G2AVL8_9BACT|nr:MAG: hypothetical protein A3B74_05240 [Candidatus Kerfeldbacteria bacterium RIFCSPHIGHO2_02_FULL_42_14]OGY81599.1 MAG: hypothetical protein A3E60_02005 [Candidatus Kerfeldbacteria bacterium RIFCSPHIGHO2_12_FULL_42_13]OGY83202.1 MAG: hypothetical protein A3I91_03415 [Candidatus Kerfeldbacteria bacterium RIFCSPLOWO2_02_FULL_42_19]OGY86245.1 MAG: hypothetical protein A3G01_00205 [Candidatus Kerfeldbacteria bacterium RIFCSPLOWO2_12_FULL_43_9]
MLKQGYKISVLLSLVFFVFLLISQAHAISERIFSFTSDITVQEDGSMIVTETIQVFAIGDSIKRGIFRDFPTLYRDRGFHKSVSFQVQKVLKDNKPEPYFLETLANGKRLYIGEENVFLKPGVYTYSITYATDRQLGFFETHDELYWNVTGNDWAFPIEKAEAFVHLPSAVPFEKITTTAYTGSTGDRGTDYTFEKAADNTLHFTAIRMLHNGEGLTIVVGWPKGFIAEPSQQLRWQYFLTDNRGLLIAGVGFLILVIYYIIAWVCVGRDPRRNIIVPQYTPPQQFSPAALRFVAHMRYDNKIFAATLIDLCVKGILRIEEKQHTYTVHRIRDDIAKLYEEEQKFLDKLFPSGHRSLKLKNTNHLIISEAQKTLKKILRDRLQSEFFRLNIPWFLLGVFISLSTSVIGFMLTSQGNLTAFGSGIIIAFIFINALLIKQSLRLIRLARFQKAKRRHYIFAVFASGCLNLVLTGVGIILIVAFYQEASLWLGFVVFASVGIHAIFYRVLRQRTFAGRKLVDEIEGFRLFLSMTEKDRLNFHNPPERTPELFEKYLPYAIALDVEHAWAEQFTDVLVKASQEEATYTPMWYAGANFQAINPALFASSLGNSFSSSIASASHAPSSSSGFGGSGGSGGGGGGGGGGW